MEPLATPYVIKSFEDHKQHFIERLLERYSIQLSDGQYEKFCNPSRFKGLISKNSTKTIGYIIIKGVKVFVLYNTQLKCYVSCYPADVEHNMASAFRCCFGPAIRRVAFIILWQYMEEVKSLPTFKTIKDAALYYFEHTMFPQLHIDKYKHGKVEPLRVMLQINRILNNKNPQVKLTVRKATKEERAEHKDWKE